VAHAVSLKQRQNGKATRLATGAGVLDRPVQIYLDSSDYSTMADPRNAENGRLQGVLQYLRKAVDDGHIEIRFSIVHIVEACHTERSHKALALARATLIDELSSGKVMRHFRDIVADEVEIATDQASSSSSFYDDDGCWFPRLPNLGADVRQAVAAGLKDGVERVTVNRKARRAARRLIGDRARPGPARRDAFSDAATLNVLAREYGFTERFVQTRLLALVDDPRTTDAEVARLVEQELFQPVRFIGHYIDRFERETSIRDSIRSLGQRMIEAVQGMRDLIARLEVSARAMETNGLDSARAAIRRTSREFHDRMIHAAVGAPSPTALPALRSPGLAFLSLMLEHWLLSVAGQRKPRKPDTSDAGDLLHGFYLPYVDLWRGDRHVCDVARRHAEQWGTVVVASLFELPRYIEDALSQPRQ
jgi:hypothetical protein